MRIDSFPQLVALAQEKRDALTVAALERDVRLVRCEDGFSPSRSPPTPIGLVQKLSKKLQDWTGAGGRWRFPTNPAIPRSASSARRSARDREPAPKHPVVQAVLQAFPGATVLRRSRGPRRTGARGIAAGVVNEDGDVVVGEMEFTEEDL